MKKVKKLAVLASGTGTTLQAVIDAIENNQLDQSIEIVISDNSNAYAFKRAEEHGIKTYVLKSNNISDRDDELVNILDIYNIDLVVLLGYLKLIGPKTINKYTIINTHPSLIPKYSGKNMYGMNVHNAVYDNKEHETGVTIHFVNENYDEGSIIWQTRVPVFKDDSPSDIATRVQIVEKAQVIWVLKAFSEGKIINESCKI